MGDNGQVELNKLLASVFTVCLKDAHHLLSKSEEAFFGSMRDMRKNYLKPMEKKRYREGSKT